MLPFFSIITASFNSEKTIAKTIESLLRQSFTNFEYIIIDGASSDNTIAIIQSYQHAFKEKGISFNFITEKDKGIYDAWNKGIKMSRSSWISFLGSDDQYYGDALQKYYDVLQLNPDVNYICSRIEIIDDKGKRLKFFGRPYVKQEILNDMKIAQVGSFHKKDLFEQVGEFNIRYRIAGDLEFYIRAGHIIKPCFLDDVTAKMLNGGVSHNVYPALHEALQVKLNLKQPAKLRAYYYFCSSLLKCRIKKLLGMA